jgi:hypothetical protein
VVFVLAGEAVEREGHPRTEERDVVGGGVRMIGDGARNGAVVEAGEVALESTEIEFVRSEGGEGMGGGIIRKAGGEDGPAYWRNRQKMRREDVFHLERMERKLAGRCDGVVDEGAVMPKEARRMVRASGMT